MASQILHLLTHIITLMKIFALIPLVCCQTIVLAQWNQSTSTSDPIHRSGNVGIGTSANPGFSLAVKGVDSQTTLGGNTKGVVRIMNHYAEAIGRRAELQFALSESANELLAVIAGEYSSYNGYVGGDLVFGTTPNNSASMVERMRIGHNGYVGIGSEQPLQKLDVRDGVIQSRDGNFSGINVRIDGRSIPSIRFSRFTGIASNYHNAFIGQIWNPTLNEYVFAIGTGNSTSGDQNATSEHITVTLNGKVGIGRENPAWTLDVNGPIASEGQAVLAVNETDINIGDISSNDGYRNNLSLLTGDTKRLSINGDGNIGIGMLPASHRLTILSQNDNVLALKSTSHSVLDIDCGPGLNSYVRFSNNSNARWDLASESGGSFRLYDYGSAKRRLVVTESGNIGIGVDNPDQKLTVDGQVRCEEVKIEIIAGSGPDFVFEKDYNLPSLTSIESYIKENKHLPEVPSAKEMEKNGVNVGEMEMLLLKKIEELTLYVIEQNKKIEHQSNELQQQKAANEKQQKEIDKLRSKK
jgi:hypothetical protein